MSTTIITVSLWIAALALGVLAVRVWRQSQIARPIAFSVVVMLTAAALWCVAYLVEIYTVDPVLKLAAYRAKFLWIAISPVAWFTFAVRYIGRDYWLTRRNLLLLGIIPLITTVLVWTNEWHHAMWVRNTLVPVNNIQVIVSDPAWWFWVHFAYSYVVFTTGAVLLARRFPDTKGTYRRQLGVLLLSVAFPYIAVLASIFGFGPLDLGPIAFTITGIALGWGYLRYHLFDLVPIARDVVIDSMTDGMMVLDTQQRIVDINPAAQRTFSQPVSQLLGKTLAELLGPIAEDPALTEQYNAGDFSSGELVLGKGEAERHLDIRVSALRDPQHRLNGRVVVFRDITEQKQAEQHILSQNETLVRTNHALTRARQKAEEADLMKSQFLATMSHELRTPLNAIIGYSEIQLMGMVGPLSDEQRNYQERVLVNAEHLLELINGVLDITKIESGRVELVPKPFNVKQWLDETLQQNRVLAEEKGLYLDSSLDPKLPESINADAGRLKQIVINLVGNAIKFTEKGYVRVGVWPHQHNKWQIVVSDSGIGIPSHAHDAIFDEFWQVDGGSQRMRNGSGLGLAIVRKLVLLMGGTIQVESEVGKGSTFIVTLPLAEIAEPAFAV